jgi:cell division protease FtsH
LNFLKIRLYSFYKEIKIMTPNFRQTALWAIVIVMMLALFSFFQGSGSTKASSREVIYSQFMADVDAGRVREIMISGQDAKGVYTDGTPFTTFLPFDLGITTQKLIEKGIKVNVKPPGEGQSMLLSLFSNAWPILLMIGFWIFMMRNMNGGANKAMGFGKSKAKLLTEANGRITFENVAGIDEAKADLMEIVEFLRDPTKFQKLGGRIPRGVLLVGPPGTGKTLTARAVAGEANVPFFTISGSDFVEMFVGVGASRVRDMFDQAKKNSPCIIFIDEIDAVGRSRGAGIGGGNDEREQTLNQLLVEMDGFEANEGVIIIAATNRPDVLDPALLRPGRFDRQVVVSNPDINGREQILKVHVKKVPLAPDVDLKVIARGCPGFSGADLMNLVNEAALRAARLNKRVVTQSDFEEAKDKVMMGTERRSMLMSEEEKMLTAYHEAGHALVILKSPVHDPIHKATIIPRGRALGMVMWLPENDKYSRSFEWYKSRLAVAFGGREAELIKFGADKVTSGASGDIQGATSIARSMVMEVGMSEKLGRVRYAIEHQGDYIAPETAKLIDEEVRALIEEGEATARRLISENMVEFEAIAQALLEYETLTGDELKGLMAGIPVSRKDPDEPIGPKVSAVPKTGRSRPAPDAPVVVV